MNLNDRDRPPAPPPPQGGRLLGRVLDDRFVLRSVLGVGGMGTVYRAEQFSMNRDVAVKVLRSDLVDDESAVRRFLTEARAASRLKSPHTVTVFDFGRTADGILYIAMELLDGHTLAEVMMAEGKPFPLIRATRLVNQVLDSMEEAHAVGVLHRDLKPDNVFRLEGAGSRDFVKVLDWGVAKMIFDARPGQTIAGLSFGTPVYMSPEQMMGREVGPPTDLYAVAIMLVELLAGRPPVEDLSPVEMVLQKMEARLPLPRDLLPEAESTDALDDFLSQALAPAPEDRFSDVESFRTALNAAVRASTSGSRPEPVVRPTPLSLEAVDTRAAPRPTPAHPRHRPTPALPPEDDSAEEVPVTDDDRGTLVDPALSDEPTQPGAGIFHATVPRAGVDPGATVDLLSMTVGDRAHGRHGTVLGIPLATPHVAPPAADGRHGTVLGVPLAGPAREAPPPERPAPEAPEPQVARSPDRLSLAEGTRDPRGDEAPAGPVLEPYGGAEPAPPVADARQAQAPEAGPAQAPEAGPGTEAPGDDAGEAPRPAPSAPPPPSERRLRARIPHLTSVTCVADGQRHRALVADVSEAGAFVNSAWLPRAGQELAVVFRSRPDLDSPGVVVRSQVVRVVETPERAGEVRGFSVRWMTLRTQGELGHLQSFYRSLFGAPLPADRPPGTRAALWEWSFGDRTLRCRGEEGTP